MTSKDAHQVQGLSFWVEDLISETECIVSMGEQFIETGFHWVLPNYREQLQSVASAGMKLEQRITLDVLQTRLADVRGRQVYARIRGNWQVTPVSQRVKKSAYNRKIAFSGIASTMIELFQDDSEERVAMWRIEIGSKGAPGCFFHVQVLGDSVHPPFPKTIEIPRLPSFFATPMSAVSYAFGELFGHEWTEAIAAGRNHGSRWTDLQRHLFSRQLEWYSQIIRESDNPNWMAIKEATPRHDLFL